MKKIPLLLSLLYSTICYCQIDTVFIIVGKSEPNVVNFFEGLNSEKPNQYFNVDRKITDVGELVLSTDFGLIDQAFFKCLNITCLMESFDGKNYCTNQMIYGDAKYLPHYLNYIKSNFVPIGDGKWEKSFYDSKDLKIEASFTIIGDKFGVYFRLSQKLNTEHLKYLS